MRIDPITLKYFVQTAWGLSNGFLSKFKARIASKQQFTATDNVGANVDYFIDVVNENVDGKTVIDDHELATKRFTASYLFSLNRCRQLAIDDPSNITTAEYWQRHRAARNEFKEVNDETKEL